MTSPSPITLPRIIGLDLRARPLVRRRPLAEPNTPAEILALMTEFRVAIRRGQLQQLSAAASAHKMKRAEFIRHLITTHPLMQEDAAHG